MTRSLMDSDETSLPNLTRRQEEILSLIIRSYSRQPEPVSSRYVAEAIGTQISSATVRNDMAVLEETGYITMPHTSAGRVPTEQGYRYFVRHLMQVSTLEGDDADRISSSLQQTPLATEQWMNAAASSLARAANAAALVTAPAAQSSRFKHVELIGIQGRLVMLILVLSQGSVHQQMLTLAEPVPQARLSEAAAALNKACIEAGAGEVQARVGSLPVLERELAELCADLMKRTLSDPARLIYRDGFAGLIANLQHRSGAEQAVRVVEERELLSGILANLLSTDSRDAKVLIGGNGQWEELSHLTIILSRYGIPDQVQGAVGVVGPTNIDYVRAISAVNYVSDKMTSMLTSAYDADVSGSGSESSTNGPTSD